MKIVAMSDTHGVDLSTWDIPDGDVLIHSGDFCKGRGLKDVELLREQLDRLPHPLKLVIAGNHDDIFQKEKVYARAILEAGLIADDEARNGNMLARARALQVIAQASRAELAAIKPVLYLEDDLVTVLGKKFYGTPWQPDYLSMAFNLPKESEELAIKREQIPAETNVLITHCPPAEILDWLPHTGPLGCSPLRYRVDRLARLELHCFGHIHEGYGCREIDGKCFVNGALLDTNHRPVNQPIVIEIDD